MIRAFKTHEVRNQQELSNKLWRFTPLAGKHEGKSYQMMVPSCWETHSDFANYRDEGMYATSIEASGTIRLIFKGVSHTATVYLDGTQIASHYNAYTPFEVIVTDLEAGKHLLEVKADNRFSDASALHIENDYYSYGGITRAVALEKLGDAYIKWVHFTPLHTSNGWHGKIDICLHNTTTKVLQGLSVTAQLEQTGCQLSDISLNPSEEKVISQTIAFDQVKSWQPDNPYLYLLSTVLHLENEPIDDLIERVGFREIKTEGNQILINNQPIRIIGFNRHEDHPHFGCALPYAAIEYDLRLIRDLGANSVRTAHYPNDEIFLDLCDEMGLLVWEENHARGLSEAQMRNSNFDQQCEDCIREMIMSHYNHPSIYIWGILNECASDTEYGRICYAKQYKQIRQLDSSRPRSSATCKMKDELCLDIPEVVSYNIYPDWYHETSTEDYLDDLYNWVQTESPGRNKPFLITEIGAGAIYGYRTPTKTKWSEEYQTEALERQLQAVLNKPGCNGVYIWQFCDVRVTKDWFPSRPRTMNNKGVVDEFRRPKLSYEVVKKIFKEISDR